MSTTEDQIMRMCFMHTVEFYSVGNKIKILKFAGEWVQLENITLSEATQAQKDTCSMFFLSYMGSNICLLKTRVGGGWEYMWVLARKYKEARDGGGGEST